MFSCFFSVLLYDTQIDHQTIDDNKRFFSQYDPHVKNAYCEAKDTRRKTNKIQEVKFARYKKNHRYKDMILKTQHRPKTLENKMYIRISMSS